MATLDVTGSLSIVRIRYEFITKKPEKISMAVFSESKSIALWEELANIARVTFLSYPKDNQIEILWRVKVEGANMCKLSALDAMGSTAVYSVADTKEKLFWSVFDLQSKTVMRY